MTKAEQKQARLRISAYHQKKLAELLQPVIAAVEQFKQGKIEAFDLDEIIHREHQQAQELYIFINNYYDRNAYLSLLIDMIEKEERGEWKWEPKRQRSQRKT